MKKRLPLLFLCIVTFINVSSTNIRDSICIAGRVSSTNDQPVEALIVTALLPSDSSVTAYCMTDKEGRYRMKFMVEEDEILVCLTGFNVKRDVRRVKAVSQTINFNAEEESIILSEVQIKAQKLWGNRDTLNYLVAAYMTEYDRTIGDVLKQLPGITIDKGLIKYQGEPINHFYIENMDVLQGRYKIAIDGLKAEDVASVQVLENHEHIKAIQDQVPPESAAINLKLKEKAKAVWTKSFGVGLGYDDDMMWNCEANLMYFDKRHQHVIYYGNDNTGTGANRSSQYYGNSGLGATVLTNILYPGSSPVGNTLRNNEHALNINNVSKLNEKAQLHYNLSYNHDIQKQNSYKQTTYLLPGSDVRIVSEDVSSRHTTNDVSIQLSYEENSVKKYLCNTLDMSGQWSEANGTVKTSSETIRQHAYNRNLGLTNNTHWIHRTEGGNGVDFTSKNTIQVTPQALSVKGDMDARQEVDITRINTSNNFSLVKDIRRHRWSIVPTAAINVDYVGMKSLLNSSVTDSGDMDYIYSEVKLGTTLRYVKNEFRLTFNLPLALSYTDVKNEVNALQTHFSPSFKLLWKANDNWTLSCGGNYGMYQTPWNLLVTSYIMENYRTTSRYVANLSDESSATLNAKLTFKDIMSSLFVYMQGDISHSWSKIMYGTTIDENGHTVMQAEYMPHHDDTYSLTGNISKGFDWMKSRLEANVNYTRNNSSILRQSVATDFHSNTFSINSSLSITPVCAIRIGYNCRYTLSQSVSADYNNVIRTFNQNVTMNTSFIRNRLMMNVTARHTYNSDMQGQKNYAFMDFSLTYRTKKKTEFALEVSNLFNTRTFVEQSETDMTKYLEIYHLRPRSIMCKLRFNL